MSPLDDWHPAGSDLEGLGERARCWLDATLRLYRLNDVEGQALLLAMRSLDRLNRLEEAVAERIDRQVRKFAPDQQDQLRAGLELLEQLTADLEERALHADFDASGQSSENE